MKNISQRIGKDIETEKETKEGRYLTIETEIDQEIDQGIDQDKEDTIDKETDQEIDQETDQNKDNATEMTATKESDKATEQDKKTKTDTTKADKKMSNMLQCTVKPMIKNRIKVYIIAEDTTTIDKDTMDRIRRRTIIIGTKDMTDFCWIYEYTMFLYCLFVIFTFVKVNNLLSLVYVAI